MNDAQIEVGEKIKGKLEKINYPETLRKSGSILLRNAELTRGMLIWGRWLGHIRI